MNAHAVCTLVVAAVSANLANSASMDLRGAQVAIRDSTTISIIGAAGAGSPGEQRFRWDAPSESFVRVGLKDEVSCATGPFRDSVRTDGAFSITIASSLANKSLTVVLERVQGVNNFPVGINGFTIFQGKSWFRLEETAGAHGSSLYAKRVEPNTNEMLLLPVGGRAVYRVESVPNSLDLRMPITAIANRDEVRFECRELNR